MPPFGLVLAVAGVDLHGQDVRQRRVGPAAVAEAGMAAQHHQARPLPHGLGQQALLLRRQVVGGEVAEDVGVVPARRELGVVDRALVALRRAP